VLYREGKEDRSWKKEEALREGKTINGARYFPNFIHAPIPTDMILFHKAMNLFELLPITKFPQND
ncbi:MAG: hypothetical protein F6K48_23445, partial [Okeania sp. SIO3H1]|nr:hypothetical protein [Okeania sp. SIO3H1]